jgi:hypothetical protein
MEAVFAKAFFCKKAFYLGLGNLLAPMASVLSDVGHFLGARIQDNTGSKSGAKVFKFNGE